MAGVDRILPASGEDGAGNGQDVASLVRQFAALSIPADSDLLVHCSMRSVGAVRGGPATVVVALRDVVGTKGTLVVPTQTPHNSTTSHAFREATRGMAPSEVAEYISRIEGFDAATTPSRGMGRLAEYVRRHPESVRSAHPQTSFAALGPSAADLMAVHDLDCHLGPRSPLGTMHERGAHVLLLGVGYEACTALHLAEYLRAQPPPLRPYRCYVRDGDGRRRLDFVAPDLDDRDFGPLGAALHRQSFVRSARVGGAVAIAMPLGAAVAFAIGWMDEHRRP
jgi:aminoglycoside 3-N-acetyltransferase